MESPISLVWVHLGPTRVPKYLRNSIENAATFFPSHPKVLLVDNDINHKTFGITKLEVRKVQILDSTWDAIRNSLTHNMEFRNQFWFNSIARFRAIQLFMVSANINRLLHIESDVVLLPEFPFEKFEEIYGKLAYSIQGSGQGIASLLYVGSTKIMHDFVEFCRTKINQSPKSTDMTLLYDFFKSDPSKVFILPTLPTIGRFEHLSKTEHELASTNFLFFDGLFDAISIGQYLLGIDPRNSRGIRRVYWEDGSHWVVPSSFQYAFKGNLKVSINNKDEYKIFSLHVHSKDLRAFSHKALEKLVKKRITESSKGPKNEFVWKTFLNSVYHSLKRRILHKSG